MNIYLGLGYEFGPQRISDLFIMSVVRVSKRPPYSLKSIGAH